jgi:hypothetical protein
VALRRIQTDSAQGKDIGAFWGLNAEELFMIAKLAVHGG